MKSWVFFISLISTTPLLVASAISMAAENDDHGDHNHASVSSDKGHGSGDHDSHDDHDEEPAYVELNQQQMAAAQIEIATVELKYVARLISAPGEVVVNSYRTSSVTPQINAKIIERYVRLGDHVKADQPLVRLAGVEMADAQGTLLQADRELRRVKSLGRKVVSEKRFTAAQVAYHKAYSQVSAYGMTENQIRRLLKDDDTSKANGEFKLLAIQAGTVIKDDFVLGEIVPPGKVLMQITDETRLWAEARLPADSAMALEVGAEAIVALDDLELAGKVVQVRHLLDETTRTQSVYVEFDNPIHRLHPGQFVTVRINTRNKTAGIVVPTEAVLRDSSGQWRVFVETTKGRFIPQAIDVLANYGETQLVGGLREGMRIVGQGAFFIQSEMAKAGFDTHNH